MIEEGKLICDSIRQNVSSNFLPELLKYLSEESDHALTLLKKVDADKGLADDDHTNIATHKAEVLGLVNSRWQHPESVDFKNKFDRFYQTQLAILQGIDSYIIKEQEPERFHPQKDDPFSTRVIKKIKYLLFIITEFPNRVMNVFRKKKRKKPFWNQKIPLQALSCLHFKEGLIGDLFSLTDVYYQAEIEQYLAIKKAEENPSSAEVLLEDFSLSTSAKQELDGCLNKIIDARCQKFEADLAIAGTIEFRKSLGDNSNLAVRTNAEDKWALHDFNWQNTVYAFMEEWRSDLEVYALNYSVLDAMDDFSKDQLKKLSADLDPEVNAVISFVETSLNNLSSLAKEELPKELKILHYKAKKTLDLDLIPALVEKLSSQTIINLINKLESTVKKNIQQLTGEHVTVTADRYDAPLRQEELKKISLNELITFEILKAFENELAKAKKELFTDLKAATEAAADIDHIITFSLSSALDALTENPSDQGKSLEIATEGLQRGLNRLNETKKQLEKDMQEHGAVVISAAERFCEEITKLTVNENLSALRLRIVTAKTKQQAEDVTARLNGSLREKSAIVLGWLNRLKEDSITLYKRVSSRFILTASKPEISKEVSDFLYTSQLSMDSLPLVYRKLYKIEPLTDLELFEGRTIEKEMIISAYKNWQLGRYGATAIIGEKWSGISSFISFIITEQRFEYPVVRYSFTNNLHSEEALKDKLLALLDIKEDISLDELKDRLNEGLKKIIFLEDLQNLYLRKVGGFSALEALFNLIANTHQNVFWVCSCTLYTWQYLNRAIHIQDFFSYRVEMSTLSNDQLINIIWKRNRISGYHVCFQPNQEREEDKKFLKANDETQQEILKSDFFKALTEFSRSNVSIALIYWLLSTKEVTDDTVIISPLAPLDLNFLKSLTIDKIQVLHALIVHDGLSAAQVGETLNLSAASARLLLLPLQEDGLLLQSENRYWVTPLVYRSTIALLKAKNLIH